MSDTGDRDPPGKTPPEIASNGKPQSGETQDSSRQYQRRPQAANPPTATVLPPQPHELTAEWTVRAQLTFARAGEKVQREFSSNDPVNPVRVVYKWSAFDSPLPPDVDDDADVDLLDDSSSSTLHKRNSFASRGSRQSTPLKVSHIAYRCIHTQIHRNFCTHRPHNTPVVGSNRRTKVFVRPPHQPMLTQVEAIRRSAARILLNNVNDLTSGKLQPQAPVVRIQWALFTGRAAAVRATLSSQPLQIFYPQIMKLAMA